MVYLNVFKEILAELGPPKKQFLERKVDVRLISQKAIILTGVRRSGKSTLVGQLKEQFSKENKKTKDNRAGLTINFIDERLIGCTAKDLSHVMPAFFELFGEIKKIDFYLDEIQVIDGWEYWVERLLRNSDYRIFITGSNSKMLSSEIGTVMRGRSLSTEVFPFSFAEHLAWNKIQFRETVAQKTVIMNELKKYLKNGGFPEVIKLTDSDRIKVLQEYRETMIFRDLVERHKSDAVMTNRLVHILLGQVSSMVTINKTVEKLKSQGIKANKENISNLFEWLQEPYLFFFVSYFSESIQKQQVNPKKVYAIDTGLVRANYSGFSENSGRLLENCIFLHLRRKSVSIYYWKDKYGNEVDFIFNEKELIQVCESLVNEETKRREVKALKSAMLFFKIKKSKIITINEEDEIKTEEGTIQVIPAYRFLLT